MDVYEELIREREAGRSCALAVIVNATGSIPSYETAKMLVREDGSIVGTVGGGGGAGEGAVIREAKEAIASGRP
jgi:xanthine dehydrogenase accessory factor